MQQHVPRDGAVVLAAAGARADQLETRKVAVAARDRAEVAENADEVAALEAHLVADLEAPWPRLGRRLATLTAFLKANSASSEPSTATMIFLYCCNISIHSSR